MKGWVAILALLLACACVEQTAKLEGGGTISVELPGGALMEMVWIEPGRFTMGTPTAQARRLRQAGLWNEVAETELPARSVRIERGFYLGRFEVTQRQWKSVTGTKPWLGLDYTLDRPRHPAVYISWTDVQQFILHLNVGAGAEVFRLPTEAEWEYACRAGSDGVWSFGDNPRQLDDYAWYLPNSWALGWTSGRPVGTKAPNAWGLYDMHGNVWEWCQDWGAFPDPEGGYLPVLKGGSFFNEASNVRSAGRIRNDPDFRFGDIGVRLVRVP
ncbi:MAG: SUMF1/EgtB/PvdO family nonheme iron enzyme [Candidatus Latescibacteria bacterium]|nr:SUMF1/EgtB/PvdO family nonheme iron enzyme [Candidatus Latescibacterota bacterium]